MATITLDPATRLEGNLRVRVETEGGAVVSAQSSGIMFRGFEVFLAGKDPRDAVQITQRVCGVCPISHAMASVLANEAAAGLQVTDNARILRNLILGADYLHSHVLQFYHLSLPSYLSFKGTALEMPPWAPGSEADLRFDAQATQRLLGNYVQALSIRRQTHEMRAILAGKLPETSAYEFGGVAIVPKQEHVDRFRQYLDGVMTFIGQSYLPDVELLSTTYPDYFQVGVGYGNLLTFGVFDLVADGSSKLLPRGSMENALAADKGAVPSSVDPGAILEDVKYSWYEDSPSCINPGAGATRLNSTKSGAYSWLKAPRYGGIPYEVGRLARLWVSGDYRGGASVMDRHLARSLEARKIGRAMREWLGQLDFSGKAHLNRDVPVSATGIGMTEAPRGALGHWLKVENRAITNYQILTPTCWNFAPRDNAGVAGPLEKALEGTPVADGARPIKVLRVVQSFDPCLACAVH